MRLPTVRLQNARVRTLNTRRFIRIKAISFICAAPLAACLLFSAVGAEPAITANPAAAGDGVQVGVAKRDGITMSGGEAYVTRNGATES